MFLNASAREKGFIDTNLSWISDPEWYIVNESRTLIAVYMSHVIRESMQLLMFRYMVKLTGTMVIYDVQPPFSVCMR